MKTPNELRLLSDEAYAKTYADCGDGSNFTNAESTDEVARALMTYLWEQGFIKPAPEGDENWPLEIMLAIKSALSEAAGIEIKALLSPLRTAMQTIEHELSELD